jgi:dTDP-glucose 4,6-dehydratase
VSDGLPVRALVRYTSDGRRGWLESIDPSLQAEIELVHGDVRDPDQMRSVVAGCDTVFHLAALIGIPYSYDSPRQNLETNAGGTLNLVEAARRATVGRFVQVSSSEVYGSAQYVPIDERHPLIGQSPYAASKIAADQITISYSRSFGLPAVVVRPFNTFGPRQSLRAVIPTIATQALWSERIRIGALHTRRDFTFVTDTAAGLIAAAQADDVEGEVFNLGTGNETEIGDLASAIMALVGREVAVEQDEARMRPAPSEVERLLSDPSKARKAFRWNPATSLEAGLSQTIDWLRARHSNRAIDEFVV